MNAVEQLFGVKMNLGAFSVVLQTTLAIANTGCLEASNTHESVVFDADLRLWFDASPNDVQPNLGLDRIEVSAWVVKYELRQGDRDISWQQTIQAPGSPQETLPIDIVFPDSLRSGVFSTDYLVDLSAVVQVAKAGGSAEEFSIRPVMLAFENGWEAPPTLISGSVWFIRFPWGLVGELATIGGFEDAGVRDRFRAMVPTAHRLIPEPAPLRTAIDLLPPDPDVEERIPYPDDSVDSNVQVTR